MTRRGRSSHKKRAKEGRVLNAAPTSNKFSQSGGALQGRYLALKHSQKTADPSPRTTKKQTYTLHARPTANMTSPDRPAALPNALSKPSSS